MSERAYKLYLAKEVCCISCGGLIRKNKDPHRFKKDENGDIIRYWECPNCSSTSYFENITKLIEERWMK